MADYSKAIDPEDAFVSGPVREGPPPVGNGEDKPQEAQVCMITAEGSVLLLTDNGQMAPVTRAFKAICAQGALHQFMDAVIAAAVKGN